MKNIGNVIKESYYLNKTKLEKDYDEVLENNKTFQSLTKKLNLPKEYLMKYTSSLEESCRELENCKKCKKTHNWKNPYEGPVSYPGKLGNT